MRPHTAAYSDRPELYRVTCAEAYVTRTVQGLDYTNTNDLHTQYHSVLWQITAVNYRQVRGVMRAECEGAFGLL